MFTAQNSSFLVACTLALFVLTAGCNQQKDTQAPATDAAPGLDVQGLPSLPSGKIAGRIDLADDLIEKVSPGDVIYLMARHGGTMRTIAVAKLAAPESFPLDFELTGANVMMEGDSLSGQLKLMARVDKDGDAMTRQPGDVVGEVTELVKVPATGVLLTLNEVLQ